MSVPSQEAADNRMADIYEQLRIRVSVDTPITEKEAMEFVRNAYFRGYCDQLRGLHQEDVLS